MKPPENENGGLSAAAIALTPAKEKPDVWGESVNLAQVGRWIDEAILMNRNAGSDPCEHQRLGIWLARIRRALP